MGLLNRLFGGGDKTGNYKTPKHLVDGVLSGLIERGSFELSYDIELDKSQDIEILKVNFYGADEEMLTVRDGMLLEAFQLFLKRAVQHQFAENPVNVSCDSNGYRERENQSLEAMIEKLKEKAIEQGRSVYVKALSPKERRVVHQFLSKDERVKSKSIGDGHYKKIKIFPVNAKQQEQPE